MSALKPSAVTMLQGAPLPDGRLQDLVDALVADHFEPPLSGQASSHGWCQIDDMGATDMTRTGNWHVEPHVCVGLRWDVKNIPAALKSLELDVRVRAWCREHNRERAPSAVRAELADLVEQDLLLRTPATPSIVGVWYRTDTGEITIGSASPAVIDRVRNAWAALWTMTITGRRAASGDSKLEHFPARLPVVDWLPAEAVDAYRGLTGTERDPDLRGRFRSGEGGLFLAWLWHLSESAEGGLRTVRLDDGSELSWMVRDGLSVADRGTGKRRLVVRAADAQSDPAVRAAVVEGHPVEGLVLQVERDGIYAHTMALTVVDGDLTLTGLKLSPPIGDEPIYEAVDRGLQIVACYDTVLTLLYLYGSLRADEARWGQYRRTFARWLGDEVAAWAGTVEGKLGIGGAA